MKNLSAVLVLLLSSNIFAQANLPPEVQADLLEQEIFESLSDKNVEKALEQFSEYRELGIEMSPDMLYLEARTAEAAQKYSRSLNVLEEYFKVADSNSENYDQAITLYRSLDDKSAAELLSHSRYKIPTEAKPSFLPYKIGTPLRQIEIDSSDARESSLLMYDDSGILQSVNVEVVENADGLKLYFDPEDKILVGMENSERCNVINNYNNDSLLDQYKSAKTVLKNHAKITKFVTANYSNRNDYGGSDLEIYRIYNSSYLPDDNFPKELRKYKLVDLFDELLGDLENFEQSESRCIQNYENRIQQYKREGAVTTNKTAQDWSTGMSWLKTTYKSGPSFDFSRIISTETLKHPMGLIETRISTMRDLDFDYHKNWKKRNASNTSWSSYSWKITAHLK